MSESDSGFEIRAATESDLAAVCKIYRWEVLNRAATFELAPPDRAEMLSRMRNLRAAGMPYLSAEARVETRGADGAGGEKILAGFAYASPFRARAAYRFTVEDSIYVGREFQRRGVGGALLRELIAESERLGFRQMTAVISDPENGGSVALHRRAGFRRAGTLKNIGWKFGRWIDVAMMTRPLGPGNSVPPSGP